MILLERFEEVGISNYVKKKFADSILISEKNPNYYIIKNKIKNLIQKKA